MFRAADDVLIQFGPPDDEHLLLETCRGINKYVKKECVKLVITQNYTTVKGTLHYARICWQHESTAINKNLVLELPDVLYFLYRMYWNTVTLIFGDKSAPVLKLSSFLFLILVWRLPPTRCRCSGLLLHLMTHTTGRTPLDEGSALRITHNFPKRQKYMARAGYEPAIPASEWRYVYVFGRAGNRVGVMKLVSLKTSVTTS
jgi:hypothetical protein